MKKLLLVAGILLVSATAANAQASGIDNTKWDRSSQGHYPLPAKSHWDVFASVQMEVNSRILQFSDLPDMKKAYAAVVTNNGGEQVRKKRISPADNELNLLGLGRGLYFVTIEYKGKGRKTFVVNFGG